MDSFGELNQNYVPRFQSSWSRKSLRVF